ncbi:MAG: nuclear transport factor 2 family protein [Pseudomonadota bacterium]
MTSPLSGFAADMDRCWQERRFDDLRNYLDENIVIVAPGGGARTAGIEAAIGSYREFMSRSAVTLYETSDTVITERGDTAIIEYSWVMDWTDEGTAHQAEGREILVLGRSGGEWKAVWRKQLAG